MVAQASASFEVGVGASATWSSSLAFSIPYGTYECQYGSKWVYTYGTENYWSLGKLKSSKSVNGKWTYKSIFKQSKIIIF
jgi:hypothetical protein